MKLTVELVHDQSGPLTADVLNLGKLRVGHNLAGRVTRIRGQNDGGTTGNFLSNLLRVDVVIVVARQRDGDGGEVLEKRQHFIVRGVVGDEEGEVAVSQDSGDTDQTGTAAGDNADVLPSVLARPVLPVVLIVEVGDSLAQRLDAGSRAILAATQCDVDIVGALKAAFDFVVDFRGALAQVGPGLGFFEVALLVGALRGPDDAGGGPGCVETSVDLKTTTVLASLPWDADGMHNHLVASVVISELAMSLGVQLCGNDQRAARVGIGNQMVGEMVAGVGESARRKAR